MTLTLSNHRDSDADGDAVTVVAEGEIDLVTAEELERELLSVTGEDGPGVVVVDLSGVGFIDSAGISTLLKGRRLADERGKRFRVTGAQGLVRQVLEITGVLDHLTGQVG